MKPTRWVVVAVAIVCASALVTAQTPSTDQLRQAIDAVRKALDAVDVLVTPPPLPPPPPPPPTGTVVTVPSGGNLQAAIDAATAGTTIVLDPAGTYSQITLRNKGPLTTPITIKSSTTLAIGVRVTAATPLPKIVSNDGLAPIRAEQRASNYVLDGLAPQPVAGNGGMALVEFGSDSATLSTDQPDAIVLQHMKILADPTIGGKRGIAAQTRTFTLRDSYIAGFKWIGQDSQGFAAWNGPGPYTIENNYVEASGENILFGGADARSPANQPRNVIIRGNYVTKPVAWKANASIQVKTGIEIKDALGVLIENNTVENTWHSAQNGYLLLLTPRNDNGTAPFTQVRDVVVQWNVFRHGAAFAQVLGEDDIAGRPSARTINVKFSNNLVYDIDAVKWGEAGHYVPLFLVIGGPQSVDIGHVTALYSTPNSNTQSGVSASIELEPSGPHQYKADGFSVHDSILSEGRYTIFGPAGQGRTALNGEAPNAILQDTLFIRNAPADVVNYGPDTNYVSNVGETVVDPGFKPLKTYATTDGKPIGVDLAVLRARIPSLDLTK